MLTGLAALALPAAAMGHPNLEATATIDCTAATFTTTGLDTSGPVAFRYEVRRDAALIASGQFTQAAPGGTVTVPITPPAAESTNDYTAYLAWEGRSLRTPDKSLTCGTPAALVTPAAPVTPMGSGTPTTPVAAAAAVTPTTPVTPKPKPRKRKPGVSPACQKLKQVGAGRGWYVALHIDYDRCHHPARGVQRLSGASAAVQPS